MNEPIYQIIFLAGRILFGGYFFFNGLNHFLKNDMLSQYASSKGVPMSKLAVYGSGLMILLGGLGVLAGRFTDVSLALIAIFLLIVSFVMHNYWKDADSNTKMVNMVNFLKNMALLGAALMLYMIPQEWPLPII